jgi:hypothetical protein
MRYALLIVGPETANPSPEPPSPELQAEVTQAYLDYTRLLRDRGAFLGGEALQPNPTATTVRVEDGAPVVTDGPFIEAKEALGGFYVIEARDLDEALELAAACPGARWGAVEVRPVMEFATGSEEAEAMSITAAATRPA